MARLSAPGSRESSGTLAEFIRPLSGPEDSFDGVMRLACECRFVLLGEATHGTHEFYRARANITRRLITEAGFQAVAVEADWPDAYRVNRFVRGRGADEEAVVALANFKRFPRWMWRNADVLDFVGWLREWNAERPEPDRAGFYGLDLYSLHASMDAVVDYLELVDPPRAEEARSRYDCFAQFGEEPQAYGHATGLRLTRGCEAEVVAQLVSLRQRAQDYMHRDGLVAEDEYFCAEQNARVAQHAERYYRQMYQGGALTWNLRDRHMAETLEHLAAHVSRQRCEPARIVVWAHNSHLGDARATAMGQARGELNVGQLCRENYGREALLVGFTTYDGTVSAASDWGGAVHRKTVRPARADSYEHLFHTLGVPNFEMTLRDQRQLTPVLRGPLRERAIGVIYRPETELASHYFAAALPDQFDAVIHFDHTRAVEPLDITAEWERGDVPETFPFGV